MAPRSVVAPYHPSMDLNPQSVADAQFRIVRKGYDPEQVRPLLAQAAESLRNAVNRATTAEGKLGTAEGRASDAETRAIEAEARAKAALQAASSAQEAAGEDPDRMRRAILTAQKAADGVVADAQQEAAGIVSTARGEAKKITTDARAAAARMVADAEQAARAAHAAELERTRAEVAEVSSRRDQLRADADLLAAHLTNQRERVADSIASLQRVLEHPTALRSLPVPEKGHADRAGEAALETGSEADREASGNGAAERGDEHGAVEIAEGSEEHTAVETTGEVSSEPEAAGAG